MSQKNPGLKFDNKVAVITGGNSELSKRLAIELAKRGAQIVINDQKNPGELDDVINQIKNAEGEAISSFIPLENSQEIIKQALDTYGKIDLLINNIEDYKENEITETSDEDWEKYIKINLTSPFRLIKSAWIHMRAQKFGRIVNISSHFGLFGEYQKLGLSASKIGLHGLTQIAAREGEKFNIKCNTILPIISQESPKLSPENIVPLIIMLLHDFCKDNGGIYEAGGGFISKLRIQRAKGVFLKNNFSPESLKAKWKSIKNFEGPYDYPASFTDSISRPMVILDENRLMPRPKI